VIAIALALVLPWVAVVAANSPARSRGETPSLYRRRPHREITDREETGD
jgi:hypothetical protein